MDVSVAAEVNSDDFPDEYKTCIYRVVQEALTNIVKHAAGATAASITVDRANSILRLTIEDNGSGFDPTPINNHSGNTFGGLEVARRKLQASRGEGNPLRPLTITRCVPLDPRGAQDDTGLRELTDR